MSDHNFRAFVIRFLSLRSCKHQLIAKVLNLPRENCQLSLGQQKTLETGGHPQSMKLRRIFVIRHFFVLNTS